MVQVGTRHCGAGRPTQGCFWIPAFAGMTNAKVQENFEELGV